MTEGTVQQSPQPITPTPSSTVPSEAPTEQSSQEMNFGMSDEDSQPLSPSDAAPPANPHPPKSPSVRVGQSRAEFQFMIEKPNVIMVTFDLSMRKRVIDDMETVLGWKNLFKENIGYNVEKQTPPSKKSKDNSGNPHPKTVRCRPSTSSPVAQKSIPVQSTSKNTGVTKKASEKQAASKSTSPLYKAKKPQQKKKEPARLRSVDTDSSTEESDSDEEFTPQKKPTTSKNDGRKRGEGTDADFSTLLDIATPISKEFNIRLPESPISLDLNKKAEEVIKNFELLEGAFQESADSLIRYGEIKIALLYLIYRTNGVEPVRKFLKDRLQSGEGVTKFVAAIDKTKFKGTVNLKAIRSGQSLILVNQVLNQENSLKDCKLVADVKLNQAVRFAAYKWAVEVTESPTKAAQKKVLEQEFKARYEKLVAMLRHKYQQKIVKFNQTRPSSQGTSNQQ